MYAVNFVPGIWNYLAKRSLLCCECLVRTSSLYESAYWTRPAGRRVLCNQLRPSVLLSVRLSVRNAKFSYFPPLVFSDFLHQVSLK